MPKDLGGFQAIPGWGQGGYWQALVGLSREGCPQSCQMMETVSEARGAPATV